MFAKVIVALRNEKGSYNLMFLMCLMVVIVALRNEKGSYNPSFRTRTCARIVALRNEKDTTLLINIKFS